MPNEDAGIPKFLMFQPSEATVRTSQEIQRLMEWFEREISTKNHIPVIHAMRDMVFPMFQKFAQYLIHSQADMIRHTAGITAYFADSEQESEIELALAPEMADEIKAVLSAVQTLNERTETLCAQVAAASREEDNETLRVLVGQLAETADKLANDLPDLDKSVVDLVAVVDENIYEEGDDEEAEEAEEEGDDEGEEEKPGRIAARQGTYGTYRPLLG